MHYEERVLAFIDVLGLLQQNKFLYYGENYG